MKLTRTSSTDVEMLLGMDEAPSAYHMKLVDICHLLVCGATGTGKSTLFRSALLEMIVTVPLEHLKIGIIAPKVVDFIEFQTIPHLLFPIVSTSEKAITALGYILNETKERFRLFNEEKVRTIDAYNNKSSHASYESMPRLCILIDSYDLLHPSKDMNDLLSEILLSGRAVGVHIIANCTHPPSHKIINAFPSRIAFSLPSKKSADRLIGTHSGTIDIAFGQFALSSYILPSVVKLSTILFDDNYTEQIIEQVSMLRNIESPAFKNRRNIIIGDITRSSSWDELLPEVTEKMMQVGLISSSMLQRRFRIGYARAVGIINQMEILGIVGPRVGSHPRLMLISPPEFEELFGRKPSIPPAGQ